MSAATTSSCSTSGISDASSATTSGTTIGRVRTWPSIRTPLRRGRSMPPLDVGSSRYRKSAAYIIATSGAPREAHRWILAPFGLVPRESPRSVNRGSLTVAPTRRQREWRRQKPLGRRCARALHPQTVAEGKRTPVTEFWRGTALCWPLLHIAKSSIAAYRIKRSLTFALCGSLPRRAALCGTQRARKGQHATESSFQGCELRRGLPPFRPLTRAALAFAPLRLRPNNAPSPTSPTSGLGCPFLYVTFATRRLALLKGPLACDASRPARWALNARRIALAAAGSESAAANTPGNPTTYALTVPLGSCSNTIGK